MTLILSGSSKFPGSSPRRITSMNLNSGHIPLPFFLFKRRFTKPCSATMPPIRTSAAVFGSKRTLPAEVINPDAFSTPVQQLIEELRATEDPSRRLSLVAQITRQTYEPLVSELELLRTAGAVAPELADLTQQVEV